MSILNNIFSSGSSARAREMESTLKALDSSMARIEFSMDGVILNANSNFLDLLGYRLDEVVGKHHRIFVTPDYRESDEYREFWTILNQGKFHQEDYLRIRKDGREVWIQATYNPVMDDNGKPFKVVKYATDITERIEKDRENKVNANIAGALGICQANVMLADNDMKITYINQSLRDMLKEREDEIRKELPDFDMSSLVGTNVDVFHKKPGHQRKMISALNEPYKTNIKVSDLTFSLTATPWLDVSGKRIGTVVEWFDKTNELAHEKRERDISNANARVKQALDVVTTNAMIADNDLRIVYMNQAVKDMMKHAEADLRRDIPGFDASRLEGQNIDVFHKRPEHQRTMLAALQNTYKTQITVGGRTFGLIANPIFNDEKERIGTIVEWKDRTDEVSAEQEIDRIVEAAASGDLSRRIDLSGKEGFFLNLGQGLNRLLTIADSVISDTIRVFDALAHGNLTRKIDDDYQGAFDKLKQDANATVDRLTDIITRIREAASTVSTGASEIAQGNADLSKRTESQASSLE